MVMMFVFYLFLFGGLDVIDVDVVGKDLVVENLVCVKMRSCVVIE